MKLLRLRYILLTLGLLILAMETPRQKLLWLMDAGWTFIESAGTKGQMKHVPEIVTPAGFYGYPQHHGFETKDGYRFFFDEKTSDLQVGDQLSWEPIGDGKLKITNHRSGQVIIGRFGGVDKRLRGY